MNPFKETPRKFLVVLNYWNGDREMMKALADLIGDLQAKRHDKVDLLFFRRWDAEQMPHALVHRLEEKFERVQQLACRRRSAVGYPYGPNEMFYDLIEQLNHREWQLKYYAFLNMEADCCPLTPDWLDHLIEAWDTAYHERKSATGHFSYDVKGMVHLNGAAIYATDIWHKAGGMNMIGGPATVAYDIHHASRLVPLARDCSQMLLDFNRKTITEEDLFALRKHGEPVYYLHGVKDLSAQSAVRRKFVTATGTVVQPQRIKTVCTYYDPTPDINPDDQKQQIELWKQAWTEAGYNPVVLGEWDASKHADYPTLKAKTREVKQPAKRAALARLYRWLAFMHVGGGLYTEYDILPNASFSSEVIPEPDGVTLLEANEWSAVSADRRGLTFLVEQLVEHHFTTLTLPSDRDILGTSLNEFWCFQHPLVSRWNAPKWSEAPLVHFSTAACKTAGATNVKVPLMKQFLASVKRPAIAQ